MPSIKSLKAETEQVINNHLQAFTQGDVDAIMEDFAEDAVFYKQDGILRGKQEIRQLFEGLVEEMPPGSDIKIKQQVVDGELAYLCWSGESDTVEIPFATDTIIVRSGKIVKQTFTAQIRSKS